MSDSLQPCGLHSPWNSPGRNTGVGSLSLLPWIFLTQESNQGLLHCKRIPTLFGKPIDQEDGGTSVPKNHRAWDRIQDSSTLKGEEVKSDISWFWAASWGDVLISSFLWSSTGGLVRMFPVSQAEVFEHLAHYLPGKVPRDGPLCRI